MDSKNLRSRKSIRLRNYDYSKAGYYFLTICTHERELIFGEVRNEKIILNEAGKMVVDIWNQIPNHYDQTRLDEFIVMPNHFHGILVLNDYSQLERRAGAASSAPTVGQIVRRFKSTSAIAVNKLLKQTDRPLWQRNYHEHIIRDQLSYAKIAEYIVTNPERWETDTYFVNY